MYPFPGENDLYENIPIISIDQLSCDKADCVILIATSELYSEEIKEKLSEYQYPNIVPKIFFIL